MLNSSSVTPTSATSWSSGSSATPAALSAKPATRKPTSGGIRTRTASVPPRNTAVR